jgi:hypothetical protein
MTRRQKVEIIGGKIRVGYTGVLIIESPRGTCAVGAGRNGFFYVVRGI